MAHRFARAIPDELEPATLYVSVDFLTTSHLCACGCGAEVVLPLHPTKWRVSFDGATVTMKPSIGSSSLPCRSHYFITAGEVHWADPMTDEDYGAARARDRRDDDHWYRPKATEAAAPRRAASPTVIETPAHDASALERLLRFFRLR